MRRKAVANLSNEEKEALLKRTNDGRLALANILQLMGLDHPDYGRALSKALDSIPPQPKARR